jgi:GTPase Era involved in 16S rRNA processing
VINKIDKLTVSERHNLIKLVSQRYPTKTVLAASGKSGEGLSQLVAELQQSRPEREQPMDVDYDIYAEGEAELG